MFIIKPDSDETLLATLRKGDRNAFHTLYKRYWKGLYQHAFTFFRNDQDAEDVVHDVFVKLWEMREKLKIEKSIASYLYSAVKHRTIYLLGRSSLHDRSLEHLTDRFTMMQVSVLDTLEAADLSAAFSEIIETFPENMRKVFLLRSQEFTVKEIAEALGLADQTVRNNLSIGIERLKYSLSQKYPEWSTSVVLILLKFYQD